MFRFSRNINIIKPYLITILIFYFLATDNHVIPAGATVVIATFLLHRRDDIFPNPEVFNPDNFLPERCQDRHYYSFIPFSAGPRSCVGML